MAKVPPKFPATAGERVQYMTHSGNDSSTRFVVLYKEQLDLRILRRAMRHLIDRVFVLHSSFNSMDIPHWDVNDDYTTADTVKYVELSPGADVLKVAEQEALRPVYFEDKLQLYCVLVDNGSESALTLVVSHLVADGGDARYILKKLAQLYNCILADGEPDDVHIKNGDRDLLQIFDNVDPDVLDRKAEEDQEGSSKGRIPFPFPDDKDVGTPRILRRTIPAQTLTAARKKAKAQGATVNDLMLTAYYRATVKLLGMGEGAPISILSMIDLRQYMENGESEGICNLSNALNTALPDGVGATFSDTLTQITEQTNAVKNDGMAGMHDMDRGRIMFKTLKTVPLRVLGFVGKFAVQLMPMGMTNLGNVPGAEWIMGSAKPAFGYFAGQVKYKPGMQLAVMSLDGVLTMTIAGVYGERDVAMLEDLMELVEQEVRNFANEE